MGNLLRLVASTRAAAALECASKALLNISPRWGTQLCCFGGGDVGAARPANVFAGSPSDRAHVWLFQEAGSGCAQDACLADRLETKKPVRYLETLPYRALAEHRTLAEHPGDGLPFWRQLPNVTTAQAILREIRPRRAC